MDNILQNLDKFSDSPFTRSVEAVVFFLLVAAAVFLLNKWLKKPDHE
ncbi:MAG: hypothetical protein JNL74_08730 [Fibrobacteres bacterium]|nr:hypothetical protein [Fibrobacterota bacterium]